MNRPELVHGELTGAIRQTAFETHRYFGPGFLEKVYENSLAHRLRKKGYGAEQQFRIIIRDEDETVVGEYVPDILVNDLIMVEIKATRDIAAEHVAVLLNCLKASGVRVGVIVNFGTQRMQFRRFVRDP